MFLAGAAAVTALDLVSSLAKTLDDATSKATKAKNSLFEIASGGEGPVAPKAAPAPAHPTIAPGTMNALLAAQGGESDEAADVEASDPGTAAHAAEIRATRLFAVLDNDKDGAVSAAELDAALGDKADADQKSALLAKLDADKDGSISQDELTAALRNYRRAAHHHPGMYAMSQSAAPASSASAASAASLSLSA